ncbi:MAG: glycosyltransferase family 2 protein [Reyranella sp.]|nr:glycosyltransferase family 2 protein [Reyranella sp.]
MAEFHRRAGDAARALGGDYEIVMVDDGSLDNSLALATTLVAQDPHLRVVELSRNFGHHKALMAGLDHARGELCFLIDSDLEEDPALLSAFAKEMRATGADVIYGYEQERRGGLIKREGGRLAWWLIDKLYAIKVPRNHCTVRLMQREYVDALLRHRESNMVIGGLWVITGFRQLGLAIEKAHRAGSVYNLRRRVGAMIEGITSFSTAPLMFMLYFGLLVSAVSVPLGIAVIAQKLLYNSSSGWASLMVSVWFLGGIIVFSLGLNGLYLSRIFIETKNRPYVIVRKVHTRSADAS